MNWLAGYHSRNGQHHDDTRATWAEAREVIVEELDQRVMAIEADGGDRGRRCGGPVMTRGALTIRLNAREAQLLLANEWNDHPSWSGIADKIRAAQRDPSACAGDVECLHDEFDDDEPSGVGDMEDELDDLRAARALFAGLTDGDEGAADASGLTFVLVPASTFTLRGLAEEGVPAGAVFAVR